MHQLRPTHLSKQYIGDPYGSMLPAPFGWYLVPSSFMQRVGLANQQQTTFRADSDIDTPFQCIWTNINDIGDYWESTALAVQIKCHPAHKQSIKTLFVELVFPPAIDKQDY
jgi:hypothetical protein